MTLDGKKKYTAAIIAIAGTVVAQFAPEQESAIMETVQGMAPMVVGAFYILIQWLHDKLKSFMSPLTKRHSTRRCLPGRSLPTLWTIP